jgi:hypothetical protein
MAQNMGAPSFLIDHKSEESSFGCKPLQAELELELDISSESSLYDKDSFQSGSTPVSKKYAAPEAKNAGACL